MPKFVVAEMNKLDKPQSVVIHSVQILNVAFERIRPFKGWQDSDLSTLAGFEDNCRAIGMNRIAELDGFHRPCKSIGCQRIHLARRRFVLAIPDDRTIAIGVFAVVGHVATNIRNGDIHIALAIHLDFFGRNRLDILAVEATGMRVHIYKHSRLMYRSNSRVGRCFRHVFGCGFLSAADERGRREHEVQEWRRFHC